MDGTQNQFRFEGMTERLYYLGVTAIDEAGAYDPRLMMGRNVSALSVRRGVYPPLLEVECIYITGTINLTEPYPTRYATFPAYQEVGVRWSAEFRSPGSAVAGYRWVLDPPDHDLADETPREGETDFSRWSVWSLQERQTRIPGLAPTQLEPHYLYIQARDLSGSIMTHRVRIRAVVDHQP